VPVGIAAVHVGGLMMDVDAVRAFAAQRGLWVVEDAAHAFPAAWRRAPDAPWQRCGENTAAVSCFSFYANKTITTGEGGMLVTSDDNLLERMRLMALHGLSSDAWQRYSGNGAWDYRIVAAGFKYNLTDIAAAIGIHQLARAEAMRRRREAIARQFLDALADVDELELPPVPADRIHAWHLFPLKLRLDALSADRDQFIRDMTALGIACSVHWRPLHLHPYYQQTFGWTPEECPVATRVWQRLVSIPIFSAMEDCDVDLVVAAVRAVCGRYARASIAVHEPVPARTQGTPWPTRS
jgi:perosamine synthetase